MNKFNKDLCLCCFSGPWNRAGRSPCFQGVCILRVYQVRYIVCQVVIGVWRKIKQAQEVQGTASTFLESELNFPHKCQDSLFQRSGAQHNEGTMHAVLWPFDKGAARGRGGIVK